MKMNEEKNIPIEDENLEEQAEELKPEEEAEVQEEAAAQEEPAEEAAEPEEKAAEPEKGTEEDPRDKKIEELNAKYMRLMADFQNQKKRFDKEKADIHQYANEKIVKNLLEVLDNFERALDATKDADPSLHEGMELIFKQFLTVSHFHQLAQIHNANPIGHVLHNGHTVGDEQISNAQFLLQFLEQIQNLGLD
jgi:molecular chaperone GrpE